MLFAVTLSASAPLPAQDRWDTADRRTRRLPPSAFGSLPSAIRTDLERRHCGIPQAWVDTAPGNVVAGHFRDRAEVDWAVLCSVDRVSTILVYWAGHTDSVARLAPAPDKGSLQTVGGGRIGYSRTIGVATPVAMRRYHQRHGGRQPPALAHEGIEDGFGEKGSVVWYWHRGTWLTLTGAE